MSEKITRRKFISTGSVISAGMMTPGCHILELFPKKPNLLFIWTDEQRADTMAVYGNNKIKTPNLNRLAEQSFIFQKAYVTQPVSTPSRSSVMTGLYPHTSGLTANNIPLPEEVLCFPELLNDPGYKTAYMGKWHLGDEVFAQHGFETWVSIEDNYIQYYSGKRDKNTRSDYHHWLVEKGYKPDRENNIFSRDFAVSLPLEHCKPKFLEEQACDYLEKNKDHPFILYVNFLEPHMPFSGPFNDLYNPGNIDIPGNFNDPLEENEPLRYRNKREECIRKYGPGEQQFRELISRYWGLVSQVDLSIGVILDKLEKLGLADNTIVVFTSDHGDMMGSHQMVEKSVMFEESVSIPFMMRIPFMTKKQTIIKRHVSQIDIVPTLLELMNKKIPVNLEGRSLAPLLKGHFIPEDFIFIEWNGKPYNGRFVTEEEIKQAAEQSSVRTVISPDGWKLCLHDTDHSQLFNLNEDPLETTNLFTDNAYQEKIDFLTGKIKEWQKLTNDQFRLNNFIIK